MTLSSLTEWPAFLREHLIPRLQPGMILALSGPLGAGKTTCVQQLVTLLGSTAQAKSPTFALMRAYRVHHGAITRVLHIDAYRLERPEDARVLNLEEELVEPGTIACIEWPEQMGLTPGTPGVMWLEIQSGEGEERRVEIR